MKAISLLVAAALIAPLAAQNPPNPRSRVVPPPQGQQQQWPQQPGQPYAPRGDEGAGAQLPDTNLTVSLEGTTTTGSVIDLQLTGVGPTFMADQMIGEDGPVLTCQYTVTKDEKGYRVAYSIGVQLRIATSVVQGEKSMTNYQYRDVSLSGTVLCSPGVPVVIVRNAKKPLQLTVAEVPSPPAPAPDVEPGKATAPEGGR
jgi:hypothetical protein